MSLAAISKRVNEGAQSMTPEIFAQQIRMQQDFFERGTRCFQEEHAGFVPVEGIYTVANQIAHAAHVIKWFREGAFSPEGFDTDFEEHDRIAKRVNNLAEARAWFAEETEKLATFLESKTMAELTTPIVPGMIMGGAPRLAIVGALGDHTAHHRGALTIYARLLGLVPEMPYMDM